MTTLTDAPAAPAPAGAVPGRARLAVTALSLALVAALVALAVVAWPRSVPSETSAEVGFSRDMIVHHEQAVTMAFMVRDASDDPDVRTLALDMIKSQAEQQGMFLSWLRDNRVPSTTSTPMMAWMDVPGIDGSTHGGGHDVGEASAAGASTREAAMQAMGMASDDELVELGTLQGTEAEVMFLELMIRHHEGGVVMAQEFVGRSDDPSLRPVADAVITSQNRELTIMTNLLDERRG